MLCCSGWPMHVKQACSCISDKLFRYNYVLNVKNVFCDFYVSALILKLSLAETLDIHYIVYICFVFTGLSYHLYAGGPMLVNFVWCNLSILQAWHVCCKRLVKKKWAILINRAHNSTMSNVNRGITLILSLKLTYSRIVVAFRFRRHELSICDELADYKPFQRFGCPCALGRVNRYPESFQ